MGHIAGMLKQAPEETTPLQKELDHVGKLLGIIVVIAFTRQTIDARCRDNLQMLFPPT